MIRSAALERRSMAALGYSFWDQNWMRSSERLLAILSLFSIEKYEWTVEDAAEALDVSVSTAYRYFKSLVEAGLLTATSASEFGLGPAIIAMDRLIQAC